MNAWPNPSAVEGIRLTSAGVRWLVILGNRDAIEWVLKRNRMAFRAHVDTSSMKVGDEVALYATRGAFRSPVRDRARVFGLGEISASVKSRPIEIEEMEFSKQCGLTVSAEMPPRLGLEFATIIPDLDFIRKKDNWSNYVRRTLVPLSDHDWHVIKRAFERHRKASAVAQG